MSLVTVELRPHVGRQKQLDQNGNIIGTFDVKFCQFIVLFTTPERQQQELGPVEFGYVGHHAGEPLNPLPGGANLPVEIQNAILNQVNAALGNLGYPAARRLSSVVGQWPEDQDASLELGEDEETAA